MLNNRHILYISTQSITYKKTSSTIPFFRWINQPTRHRILPKGPTTHPLTIQLTKEFARYFDTIPDPQHLPQALLTFFQTHNVTIKKIKIGSKTIYPNHPTQSIKKNAKKVTALLAITYLSLTFLNLTLNQNKHAQHAPSPHTIQHHNTIIWKTLHQDVPWPGNWKTLHLQPHQITLDPHTSP